MIVLSGVVGVGRFGPRRRESGPATAGFLVPAPQTSTMNPIQRIRRLLGGGDDEPPYRCVHCGTGFERNYHDCPTCGNPYVKPTDESE